MHYVCVENGKVINILSYSPAVPESVTVTEISEEEHDLIDAGTYKFDIESKSVVRQDQSVLNKLELEIANNSKQVYLASTDWMVLRHLRELAIGNTTTLSTDKYLELEIQRQNISKSITKQS